MAADRRLTLDDVASFPRPGAAVPQQMRYSPDGRALGYLLAAPGANALSLWLADARTGERTCLLAPVEGSAAPRSLDEELRRERTRQMWEGVTSFAFASESRPAVMMVPRQGRAWLGPAGGLRAMPGTDGGSGHAPLPDGGGVVFVRGGELWVGDGSGSVPLTRGAEPGVTRGEAEFIAQEELGRSTGFWISRDGRWLALAECDARHVPTYAITHLADAAPWVEEIRYPFAGAENARVRLGVMPLRAGGEPLWLHTSLESGDEAYLARVAWTPDGELAALLLRRDQRHMEWRRYAPASGTWRTVLTDTADHWLHLTDDTRFLGSGEIVFSSERNGHRHLYVAGTGGRPSQVTDGEWDVTGLCGVDEAARTVYFTATDAGVAERHLYAAGLEGGRPRRLTREPGWHAAVFDPQCRAFADQWGSRAHAPRTVLRTVTGETTAVLHEGRGATSAALDLAEPELLQVPAADGTPLWGALYRPPAGGGGPWPLVVSVYGGPGSQSVGDRWDLTSDLQAQYLAQQGLLVWKCDNRGTSHRGAAFERAIHRRFGTVEVADQVAAVRWLQVHRGADPARTGVYGWSYGGYMTLMLLAKAPELFAVGVAGAPVTDFANYDTAYTERYMDTPAGNPEGYRDARVLTHIRGLRGRLLIIHGMVDENVHFRHTARLVQALVEAGKDFELAALPSARHSVRGTAQRRFVAERTCGFLLRHLAGR